MTTDDLYEILQVHPRADPEVIQAAYRRLAQKYHPDTSESSEAERKMKALNVAYEVLSNPKKRAEYDRQRSIKAPPRRTQPSGAKDNSSAQTLPILKLAANLLDLGSVIKGGKATGQFEIKNIGRGLLSGGIYCSQPWLKISPSSFQSNQLWIRVTVETSPLAPAESATGTIDIKSNGGSASIKASVYVVPLPQPRINVVPSRLELGTLSTGASRSASMWISNIGEGNLVGTLSCNQDWLQLSQNNVDGNNSAIQLLIDTRALAPRRSYDGVIEVSTNGGAMSIPIAFYLAGSTEMLGKWTGIVRRYWNPFASAVSALIALSLPFIRQTKVLISHLLNRLSEHQDVRAYYKRGRSLYRKKEYEQSVTNLNQAILLDPMFADAYHVRGLCMLYGNHSFAEAIKDFSKAIDLNPQLSSAFWNRAKTWQQLGSKSRALNDLAALTRISHRRVPHSGITKSVRELLPLRMKVSNPAGVYLRAAPSQSAKGLKICSVGTKVEAVNIYISKQNDMFFQVKDGKGHTGWVTKQYLLCL